MSIAARCTCDRKGSGFGEGDGYCPRHSPRRRTAITPTEACVCNGPEVLKCTRDCEAAPQHNPTPADRVAASLRELLNLCALGDVNENTEALGWGEAIREANVALAAYGVQGVGPVLPEMLNEPPDEPVKKAAVGRYERGRRAARGVEASRLPQRFIVSDVQRTAGIVTICTFNAEDVLTLRQGDEVTVTPGVAAVEAPGINETWNKVRAEARALAGIGQGCSALLTAVEEYGTACAKDAAAGVAPSAPPGYKLVPLEPRPSCCDHGKKPDGSVSSECCGNGACAHDAELEQAASGVRVEGGSSNA